ncbi:UDP-glucose 4-epimerase [hydrothermal vent metagenome]|uniref:UDP-glucose 4-epimerase n=1 Tax=hydrothermal vent metagenome TaxID=652676 RepID=A0A3B0XEV3_9ZZZZ
MKILLTGANGFIGHHLLQTLSAEGHNVVPASRKNGFNFNNMTDTKSWYPCMEGLDAVINSAGIIAETPKQHFNPVHHKAPAALFRACTLSGIKRVIQISALGADDNAFTPYQISKKAADDVLREQALDWFILRPSLVYDDGLYANSSPCDNNSCNKEKSSLFFKRLALLPAIAQIGNGQQHIQPVHINDLVAAVIRSLSAQPAKRTLDIVGPCTLTLIEWMQIIRRIQHKHAAPVFPVPFEFILGLSHIAQYFTPLLTPDNLRMLQQGSTADAQPLIDFLQHPLQDINFFNKGDTE